MGAPIGPIVIAHDPSTLPLYESIRLEDVCLVQSRADEAAALSALMAGDAIGFDTESKPTFAKGEVSNGPHLVQLATDDKAYLFPVSGGPASDVLRTVLESPKVLKVGFGLRDDLRRLQSKLGICAVQVLDLAIALRREERGDVGAKAAVARFFGQRLQKSKKTSTTNWSNPRLTERQMLYAANDAQVALRVYRAWLQAEGTDSLKPPPGLDPEKAPSIPT
jgi:RNA polymerase sigma factor for flagellar operon FliA